MKLFPLFIAAFCAAQARDYHDTAIEFLQHYFADKHGSIFSKLCWKHEKLFLLAKSMWTAGRPKYFAAIKDYNAVDYSTTLAYLLFDVKNCELPLQEFGKVQGYFDHNHKWVFLMDSAVFPDFKTGAKNFRMGVASDVTAVVFEGTSAFLYQPYKIKELDQEIVWESYGNWDLKNGLNATLVAISKADRRRNLRKAHLTVAIHVEDSDTVNHLEDLRYPHVDTPTKQDYQTTQCLIHYLNASYTIITRESHGYLNQTTGKWSGIIQDLITETAEIDGTGMFITRERLDVVDCLSFANPAKIRFLLRKPPLAYLTNILVVAFRKTVWVSMIAVGVVFALALYLILNWEARRREINFKGEYSTSDVALIVFEAICQQGSATEPRSAPGRTIMLILFLAFMFLFVSYSANVVVLLQSTGDIPDLNALLNSRMSAGALNASYMVWYLHHLKNPLHKELFDRKIKANGFYTPKSGVEEIRKGFFAFHTLLAPAYHSVMETFTDYEICSLQELEGFVGEAAAYFFVKKHSQYKEVFKAGLLRIGECGLQQHSYGRYERKPKCYSNAASFGSVGILEVYQAVLILLYGVVAAVLILIVERIVAAQVGKRGINRN